MREVMDPSPFYMGGRTWRYLFLPPAGLVIINESLRITTEP